MIQFNDKELNEACGIFATFNVHDAATLTYYGLHALQHRGQEGCGIAHVHNREFKRIKSEGLVTEVFNEKKLATLDGEMALGHVLYSADSDRKLDNVQPFLFTHRTGDFALAHNGSLVNSAQLKKYLEDRGSLFHSTSDSEILAHLIKKDNDNGDRLYPIIDALNMIEGAFAFVIMTASKMYAIRDKHGLKPLSLGKFNGGYVVSSETCAFDVIGAKFIRDVEPGEIVVIDKEGITSVDYSKFKRHNMCVMEYIYFARPDSDIEGMNVHSFRKETGKLLYREAPVDADIVIGVPDSSLSAAVGYSEESGIPYEMGLIKNKYIGRTFIQPSQVLREKGVKMKLSAVRSIVNGKRVALIDDSIVRGTTVTRIVGMLKQFGAKEIHLRIASPPMNHPCFYGVETTTQDELINARLKDIEKVRETIGADSLAYLSEESLYKASHRDELCTACFSGKYPTPLYKL
jgi:amidophosphoribosyltransferase